MGELSVSCYRGGLVGSDLPLRASGERVGLRPNPLAGNARSAERTHGPAAPL